MRHADRQRTRGEGDTPRQTKRVRCSAKQVSRLMKAINQHPFAAQEQRSHFPLARSRSLALHCCESLSLSCLCLTASRREARRLGTGADLVPNNSASSLLASSRRSFERNVTLTQDSSQRSSPSESSPSHSTRRPRVGVHPYDHVRRVTRKFCFVSEDSKKDFLYLREYSNQTDTR